MGGLSIGLRQLSEECASPEVTPAEMHGHESVRLAPDLIVARVIDAATGFPVGLRHADAPGATLRVSGYRYRRIPSGFVTKGPVQFDIVDMINQCPAPFVSLGPADGGHRHRHTLDWQPRNYSIRSGRPNSLPSQRFPIANRNRGFVGSAFGVAVLHYTPHNC
jgi:hypothetical protein